MRSSSVPPLAACMLVASLTTLLPSPTHATDLVEVVFQATNWPRRPELTDDDLAYIEEHYEPEVRRIVHAAFESANPTYEILEPGAPLDEDLQDFIAGDTDERQRRLAARGKNQTISHVTTSSNNSTHHVVAMEDQRHRRLPSACPSDNKCYGNKWKLCKRLGCPYQKPSRRRLRSGNSFDAAKREHFELKYISRAINRQLRDLSVESGFFLVVVIKRFWTEAAAAADAED